MPTLAVTMVESFLTMLDAQEVSLLFSAAQIVELVSTAANTLMILQSDAQVLCDYTLSLFILYHLCICVFGWSIVPSNCTDGQIRLRGGLNQREGRVEICYERVWGTICDTQWDYREAQVTCRQLGFQSLGE